MNAETELRIGLWICNILMILSLGFVLYVWVSILFFPYHKSDVELACNQKGGAWISMNCVALVK